MQKKLVSRQRCDELLYVSCEQSGLDCLQNEVLVCGISFNMYALG